MTLISTPLETLDYVSAGGGNSPAAETAIVSTDVVQVGSQLGNRPIITSVTLNITTGVGATALVVNLRVGVGVGGTLIGSRTVTVTASTTYQLTFVFDEPPTQAAASAGGSAYTVTVAETGASANGTVNSVKVEMRQ